VGERVFLMKLQGLRAAPGQFYMLRPQERLSAPLLGRPISVFDADEEGLSFLYHMVGQGTALLAAKRAGEEVQAIGPFGNGFRFADRDLSVIGGGIGIAPLYYLLKEWKRRFPARKTEAFLGFSLESFMVSAFEDVSGRCQVNIGGFVTEDAPLAPGPLHVACGPLPMLRAAQKKAEGNGAELDLSLEARMACGAGACLGCSCATVAGNRRVCKDGPVFSAREVLL
jgi:dihydroorotate dehydrogenase electron transfer subunit